MRPDTAIGALWLLWFLSWLSAAGWTAATRTQQAGGQRLQHGVFPWAGAFFLFSRPAALAPLFHPLYPEGRGLAWAAVFVAVLGLGWTWWARVHLGRPWSANVALKEGHAIVRSGPYRGPGAGAAALVKRPPAASQAYTALQLCSMSM